MDNELCVSERSLEFKLFECHNLAATYDLVTWGQARPLGNDFVLGVLTRRVPHAIYFVSVFVHHSGTIVVVATK